MNNQTDLVTVLQATSATAQTDCQSMAGFLLGVGLHPICLDLHDATANEPTFIVQVPVEEATRAMNLMTDQAISGDGTATQNGVFEIDRTELEALGFKNLLEANGIPTALRGNQLFPAAQFRIQVAPRDSNRARYLIAEAEDGFGGSLGDHEQQMENTNKMPPPKDEPAAATVVRSRKGCPWTPSAVGWLAIFFGPIPGAVISFANLRRLKRPGKALAALFLGPPIVAVITVLLMAFSVFILHWSPVSGVLGMLISRGVYIAFQEDDFKSWQSAHPDNDPSRWWTALPWILFGVVIEIPCLILLYSLFGTDATSGV